MTLYGGEGENLKYWGKENQSTNSLKWTLTKLIDGSRHVGVLLTQTSQYKRL